MQTLPPRTAPREAADEQYLSKFKHVSTAQNGEELTHWKDPDAGRDWGKEEKGTTEDEMAGWHH